MIIHSQNSQLYDGEIEILLTLPMGTCLCPFKNSFMKLPEAIIHGEEA